MPNRNYKILIIDDDPEFHQDIRYAFRKYYEFEGAIGIAQLEKKLQGNSAFDLILLDLVLDGSGEKVGLTLIPTLQEQLPGVPIVIVTNDNSIQTVVEATKKGAKDFLYKGEYDYEYWQNTFNKALETTDLKQKNEELKQELTHIKQQYEYVNHPKYPLIGSSPMMERIRKTLKLVADEPDLTVLITGETGVGKGVAARFLHYNNPSRREEPFEEIHISNIPKSLLESTLFGAKKGTFTGAVEDIKGRLHMANKGTVFLDEIGDLDTDNQVKLLQFLQTKTIRPIGTNKDILLDVQIVAATNKNLREEVNKGSFREDLYQRLKVFPIEIPPLRDRREDIPELFAYFMDLNHQDELSKLFESSTYHFLLEEYDWIGNIRELENAIKSIRIKQKVLNINQINLSCLPDDMLQRQQNNMPISINNSQFTNDDHVAHPSTISESMDLEEQNALNILHAIEDALIKKNGVKKDVAKLLKYNSSDHVRYRVLSIKDKYPHLLKHFPKIREKYKIEISS